MSRKTLRHASKNASKKCARSNEREQLTRSKLGLSGLAVGSIAMAVSALIQAKDAPVSAGANAASPANAAQKGTQARQRGHRAMQMASSAGLPAGGAGLIAQAAGPAPGAASSSASALQEIVVTGIRGSLMRSLQIKKNAIGVVDAISAESIGHFPDASLGAALQRVPGITVNRSAVSGTGGAPISTGQASQVTIDGFGGDFVETLVDGRPMASAATNDRQFDYASLAADFVGEIDVHKTPDFSLSSGNIGGTVNIKLPTPFENPGMHLKGMVSESDSPNDGQPTPAFGALWSDTFDHRKFGILLDGEYSDQKTDEHHLSLAGWEGTTLNSCQMAGGPTCVNASGQPLPLGANVDASGDSTVTPPNTKPSWFIQDYALYNDRTDDRRKTGRAVIQWHPTDAVMVTLNDDYSDDRLLSYRSEYSTWFNGTQLYNVQTDPNGTVTNFDYGPAPTDFDADYNGSYIKNNELGLNVLWDVGDAWTTELDADQSTSDLNPGGQLSNIDMDVGYGPSTGGSTNAYIGGIVVPGGNTLPYPSNFGPNDNKSNILGLNPYILGSHVLPIQQPTTSDIIDQVKLDATWHRGSTRVNFGAQFVQDSRNATESDTFQNNAWQLWAGYGPLSGNGTGHGQALPPSLFAGGISTSSFIPGWSGNGNLPAILEYNPYAVLNYLIGLGPSGANPNTINSAYPPYTGGAVPLAFNPGSYAYTQQRTWSPFLSLEHRFDLGDMPLNARIALRDQRTTLESVGLGEQLQSLTVESSDHTAFVFNYGPMQPISNSNAYNYFLPSLDLNLMVMHNLKLRFDASRTLTQPPLGDISPTTTENGRVGALTATAQNPDLLPYLSNNFHLGAEWYYAANDYLAVDGYFKHVSQFPELETFNNFHVNGVIDPTTGNLANFTETAYVNGPSANVDGVEVTWQQMLPLGFGYMVNGNVIHTNKTFNPYVYTNQFALPGVGDSVNFIGFYQRHGFQARVAVNWQASQFMQFGQQQNNSATGTEPTYLDAVTEVDFSTSYNINKHLSVFFEALNLNDGQYVTHGRFDNQILDVIDYGRTFTVGLRAQM